jgi:hypothetical protein
VLTPPASPPPRRDSPSTAAADAPISGAGRGQWGVKEKRLLFDDENANVFYICWQTWVTSDVQVHSPASNPPLATHILLLITLSSSISCLIFLSRGSGARRFTNPNCPAARFNMISSLPPGMAYLVIGKEKSQSASLGVLYWAMYGQTVTS